MSACAAAQADMGRYFLHMHEAPSSIYIFLSGTLRGNGNFRGFLIEGRRASSKQEGAIGEFIDFDNDLAQNTCGKVNNSLSVLYLVG